MSCGIILSKIMLWGVGGVILVLFGAMTGFWPLIFNFQLKKELILTNTSKSYDLWKSTPIPVYMMVYMFNWTNPQDTISTKAKPNFVEMGPYVFREEHVKVNIRWNSNDTVTFNQKRTWHFIPEMSKGSLNDSVTNINIIAMYVENLIKKHLPPSLYPLVNTLIKLDENKTYVTKTVDELLFKGYSDKILDLVKKIQKWIKVEIPFDKFGLFYNRNNSIDFDGVFNMETGVNGLDKLGKIVRWNYNSTTKAYPGPCSTVDGSNGDLWPYSSASQEYAKIFVTDICSSLSLKRDGTRKLHNIKGSRFIADETMFDNGQYVPDNICYCSVKPCSPPGARDVSGCRFGLPAFVSFPHFYLADSSYLKNITGMYPSPNLHEMFITLEEVTSIPLEFHAKIQINIYSEPLNGFKFYENLPYAYFPILWFHENATVTPELASQISSIVVLAYYVEPIFISLTILGALMVISGLLLWRFHFFSIPSETPLLASTSS